MIARRPAGGRREAVVFDAPGLEHPRRQVPTRDMPFAGFIRTGESYGAVFAECNRLRAPVNGVIAALRKDGTLTALGTRRLSSDLPRLPVRR